jgi:hypothetical protein
MPTVKARTTRTNWTIPQLHAPCRFRRAPAARIFLLAESLNYFRSLDLDSHHKVANMGMKTLTYEAGKEINKVQYNYTENRTAQQLTDILEKLAMLRNEFLSLNMQ